MQTLEDGNVTSKINVDVVDFDLTAILLIVTHSSVRAARQYPDRNAQSDSWMGSVVASAAATSQWTFARLQNPGTCARVFTLKSIIDTFGVVVGALPL